MTSTTNNDILKAGEPLYRSRTVWIVAAIRLTLALGIVPEDWMPGLASSTFQSIWMDSIYTLDHVQEGLAVRQLFGGRFTDAYHTHTVHLPPLLLASLEALFQHRPWQRPLMAILVLLIDLAIAECLLRIGYRLLVRNEPSSDSTCDANVPQVLRPALAHIFPLAISSTSQLRMVDLPRLAALLYWCSPVTILAGGAWACFQNSKVLALIVAVEQVWQGSLVASSFLLAIAAYIDVHYLVFVIPFVLLAEQRQTKSMRTVSLLFVTWFSCLHALSFALVGSADYWAILSSTTLDSFRLTRRAPSLSTLWYFGMEIFDRFPVYFTCLIGGAPYLLLTPMTIRLYRYPIVLLTIFWMLGALFRPPNTLYDLNIGLCLFLLEPRSLARFRGRFSVILAAAIPVPVILYLVTAWLWLETGSGEPNFVFFQCLAYNVMVGLLLIEYVSASLQRDKVWRVTEKLKRNKKEVEDKEDEKESSEEGEDGDDVDKNTPAVKQ